MRTDDLSDPESWRFWDGAGFDGTFINPYTEATDNTGAHLCKRLKGNTRSTWSLTYNNYIDRYILLGIYGSERSYGFYYSVSEDLIKWTPPVIFWDPWAADSLTYTAYAYPSLLDPDSESRNFETTGKTAYVYYTRFNSPADRDLLRIPVEFVME